MDHLDEIIRKRSFPGILIFSRDGELVFLNDEARAIIKRLCPEGGAGGAGGRRQANPDIPNEIRELSKMSLKGPAKETRERPAFHLTLPAEGSFFTARSVPLYRHPGTKAPSHSMVILEKYSKRVDIDMGKLKTRFSLSKRECEVVGELLKGRTNVEAARRLSISEHTVKDHIKNIMTKIGVNSRALIVCKILE